MSLIRKVRSKSYLYKCKIFKLEMDDVDNDVMSVSITEMRDLDLQIALSIAGFAGMPTRDRHGNVVSEVWTKCNDTESVAAKLLDFNDMRAMLKEQLNHHLTARKDMLLEVDSHDVVAKWIFDFSEAWEREYRKRGEQGWDIAQMIVTAMEETLSEVSEMLEYGERIPPVDVETHIASIISKTSDVRLYTDAHEATVRFYFRNKFTGPMLRHIAGKKLQKQIVCNRSGAYSARVQRNDVQQEVDDAVDKLYFAVEKDDPLFAQCADLLHQMATDKKAVKWIINHRHGANISVNNTS